MSDMIFVILMVGLDIIFAMEVITNYKILKAVRYKKGVVRELVHEVIEEDYKFKCDTND